MVELAESEKVTVRLATAMLLKRVISSIPCVQGQFAVGASDTVRRALGWIKIPSCGGELLNTGIASSSVKRPDIAKSVLARFDHGLANGVLLCSAGVSRAHSDGSDDRKAALRRVCEMLKRWDVSLLPAVKAAAAGPALDVVRA